MCRSKQSRCFFFFFFVLENYSLYFCCLHRENSVLSLLILLILFFFSFVVLSNSLFFFFKRVPSFFFLLFGRVGNVDVIFILVYFSELQYIVQRCRFTYAFFFSAKCNTLMTLKNRVLDFMDKLTETAKSWSFFFCRLFVVFFFLSLG